MPQQISQYSKPRILSKPQNIKLMKKSHPYNSLQLRRDTISHLKNYNKRSWHQLQFKINSNLNNLAQLRRQIKINYANHLRVNLHKVRDHLQRSQTKMILRTNNKMTWRDKMRITHLKTLTVAKHKMIKREELPCKEIGRASCRERV